MKSLNFDNYIRFGTFIIFFISTLCINGQPIQLQGFGYDSHVELNWNTDPAINPTKYQIFRAANGAGFEVLKSTSNLRVLDFVGYSKDSLKTYQYYVSALNGINVTIANSDTISISVASQSDEALLDMVQAYSFRYFWEFAHPVSGMIRERNTSGDIVTTGGTGFGVMAILVGIERGFITREQGLNRLLQMVSFLQFADSFHGVFPHWMNGRTGDVVPFSQYDDGGDLVETAFLMQGLLCARQYFDAENDLEDALRRAITSLWGKVEWDFYRKNNSNVLYWHWSPNHAWRMNFPIKGYNEALIVYLLATASPTHPVPATLWKTGWASANYSNGFSWYGHKLFVGPPLGGPLFFAHYSFLGFDPRNKRDAYANYFLQNTNHTLINRAYCIANPLRHKGYSENCWGLTASDNPFGYSAHEPGARDNGTITPTAALSSMPYTPAESLAALKCFYREHGKQLWGEMGFYDAFNLNQNWYANSYLAIDQGPIINMIENYRTGLLWDLFMANPEIQPALESIGFVEDVTTSTTNNITSKVLASISPNPSRSELTLTLALAKTECISVKIINTLGSFVKTVVNHQMFQSGEHLISFDLQDVKSGVYYIQLTTPEGTTTKPFVKQ